jgi:hypothetical protein
MRGPTSSLWERCSTRCLTQALADGRTRRLTGLTKDDEPLEWGADSRSLFVQRTPLPHAKVDRLDLITGERRPFREISLAEPARLLSQTSAITMGQDGSYCYAHMQVQTDIYLFEGIR